MIYLSSMTSRLENRLNGLILTFGLLLGACTPEQAELSPIEKAQQALAQNDPITAEVELRGMLADGTDPSEIAAYLGEAELQQGSLAEAREWLKAREFSDATKAHGYHMAGRLEMLDGELPLAGQAFDRALAAGGDDAELWVDIGRLRYRGGEQAQAYEAGMKAVELGPENLQALMFYGQLVRDSEGMEAALPWFEQALLSHPDDLQLLGEYAATLGEMGQAKLMLEATRKMMKIDPGNRKAQYLQAVLAARGGNIDLAIVLLQRSGELERGVPAAMLLSAIIDLERGNYASSAQTLERLASIQPDNRRVKLLLARALSLGRNDNELLYRFDSEAARVSSSSYLQTLVARSFEANGKRENAASLLDRALTTRSAQFGVIAPETTLSVARGRAGNGSAGAINFVRAAIVEKQPSDARRIADQFARRAPGSGDAQALLGDALLASRSLGPALDAYGRASSIRRPWPLVNKMAGILIAQGERDQALALLDGFLLGEAANVEAMTTLALQNGYAGNWESSAFFADYAILHGAARDYLLLSMRAKAAIALDEIDLAVEYAETAHDLQPMSPFAAKILLDVYRKAEVDQSLIDVVETKVRLFEAA